MFRAGSVLNADCTQNITTSRCAIPIRHRGQQQHGDSSASGDHSTALTAWSTGDNHLNWHG
jgi:hypothetical protein